MKNRLKSEVFGTREQCTGALFTYLKIILLQYFQFSVFSFQFQQNKFYPNELWQGLDTRLCPRLTFQHVFSSFFFFFFFPMHEQ